MLVAAASSTRESLKRIEEVMTGLESIQSIVQQKNHEFINLMKTHGFFIRNEITIAVTEFRQTIVSKSGLTVRFGQRQQTFVGITAGRTCFRQLSRVVTLQSLEEIAADASLDHF